jgi:hypothetical protein
MVEHLQKEKIYKTAFVTSQGVAEKFGKNRKDLDKYCYYFKKTGWVLMLLLF